MLHLRPSLLPLLFLSLTATTAPACAPPSDEDVDTSSSELGAIPRIVVKAGGRYLVAEVMADDVVHFEVSAAGNAPNAETPLYASPMIAKLAWRGPTSLTKSSDGLRFETPVVSVAIDGSSLCAKVKDKARGGVELSTFCPADLGNAWKGLDFTASGAKHVYGLGEQFTGYGNADGSWAGRARSPGGDFGNAMSWWNGGAPGNTQIPVMYALAPDHAYAMFFDNVYKQNWDFTNRDRYSVRAYGDQLRFYVMAGADLPALRRSYMNLTGKPPVPPKRMFGYWVSQFGFNNWRELDDKLAGLRAGSYPVDGAALDVFWFGTTFYGQAEAQANGPMGKLTFDEARFPDPKRKIASLRDDQGIGLMLIEESYVNKNLPEHQKLAEKGFLAKDCADCGPTFIGFNPWWGKGGMIDWTNDDAGDYWHDQKRKALVDMGVTAFWTDLGEPEMFNSGAYYAGVEPNKHSHGDVHNIYAFKWLESIQRGYTRNDSKARPFMMSRAGAGGIQRLGAGMWSGDIGSNLGSLAAHEHAQMHMSMSGVDYYGADIGGFHRESLDGDKNELYTQWFADGMLLDIPARTHAWDLCNCEETTPDRIGHAPSNFANLRRRYELSAYTYSLAHRAHERGEPVFPPLVYAFGDDPNVAEIGNEKMIGPSLLVATAARHGESERDVYLPKGKWIEWDSNEWITSSGQVLRGAPEYRGGLFTLPLFARAGSIIPKMAVDDLTMNVLGKRKDGSRKDDLVVRVYPDAARSAFTLYEDDGETTAYLSGALRTTEITQVATASSATVTIGAANGSYANAPQSRDYVVELVAENAAASSVTFAGAPLTRFPTRAAWADAATGWYQQGNLIVARSGVLRVDTAKTFVVELASAPATTSVNFVCDNAGTSRGESMYVTGNIPALGSFSPAAAIKLDPTVYPKWTANIEGLPPNTTIEWKCLARDNDGTRANRWSPGPNNVIRTPTSGPAGTAYTRF